MRLIVYLSLCLYLLGPISVWAQDNLKSPLSYSLREYGVVLGIAIMGGAVRWYIAVKKGEIALWSLSALIGEMMVSAFIGLLTFWICESMNLNPLLTPAVVGMCGHLGARGLVWLESAGKKFAEKRLGIDFDEPDATPVENAK